MCLIIFFLIKKHLQSLYNNLPMSNFLGMNKVGLTKDQEAAHPIQVAKEKTETPRNPHRK